MHVLRFTCYKVSRIEIYPRLHHFHFKEWHRAQQHSGIYEISLYMKGLRVGLLFDQVHMQYRLV